MANLPLTAIVVLLLLLLPVRLRAEQLRKLAFLLWVTGGLLLTIRGVARIVESASSHQLGTLSLFLLCAVIIGILKGKYVLAKTARRNLARLRGMSAPQRPLQVYGARSWTIIALTASLSLMLTWLGTPLLWRGSIQLAVGLSLLISSIYYLNLSQNKDANTANHAAPKHPGLLCNLH